MKVAKIPDRWNRHQFLFFITLISFYQISLAVDFTSISNGDWNNDATWSGTGTPTGVDSVTIKHQVILTQSEEVDSIRIASSGEIVLGNGGYTFNIYGYLQVDEGGIVTPGDATVFFEIGENRVISIDTTFSLYNLSINGVFGGGTKTLTLNTPGSDEDTLTILNKFSLKGKAGFATGSNIRLEYNNNASLNYDIDPNTYTIGGEWPIKSIDEKVPNIILQSGALTLSSGPREVGIKLTRNNGSIADASSNLQYSAGGILEYTGTSTKSVDAEWPSANAPDSLIVNIDNISSDPDLDLGSSSRSINGSLHLTNGSVDFSGTNRTFTVGGNVRGGSGTFGADDDTLVVIGTNSEITTTNSTSISNIRISPSGNGVVLKNNITVEGLLHIRPTLSTNEVTLGGGGITIDAGELRITRGIFNLNGNSITKIGSNTLSIETSGILLTGGTPLAGFTTYTLNGEVRFTGDATETIPTSINSFTDVTIFNTGNGVVLASGATPTINGLLTLSDGIFNTENGTLTFASGASPSSGSDQSYIAGPTSWSANASVGTEFNFPLGDAGTWRRIGIEPQTNNDAVTYTAQFYNIDPQSAVGSALATGTGDDLEKVSSVRYWTVTRSTSTNADAQVRLYWEDGSDGVGSNLNTLRVARWNGASWESEGPTSWSTSGSIQSDLVSNFSPFTLGTTNASDHSLPVYLISFTTDFNSGKVLLSWVTQSELQNEGFNIYRKEAGVEADWLCINPALIPGQGNTAIETRYEYIDKTAVAGMTYQYKLESVGYSGHRVDEKIVEVSLPLPKQFAILGNYPNPFNPTTQLKFQLPEQQQVTIYIYDTMGHLVKKLLANESFSQGEHAITWDATNEVGRNVASGMYIYRFSAGKYVKSGKMLLLK